jgi:chromosome segregation protein
MKIKEIRLYGFKSFPGETKIVLNAGITAFVGPNGSGKSNIFDALRWVFGEQSMKALRCERIEDLIYVSPDTKNDAHFTEVSITIDNEDYFPQFGGEFEIKRRFYRSGESEFFLNRVKCRLQDIQALFLNSGTLTYSFLELSEIEKIIHGDTKHMFDDVSGILKYQERREQTRRRLESTEQDLLRLEDIIHEMQRSVRSLRRQVRQTHLYQELKDEFRKLSLCRLKNDFDNTSKNFDVIEQSINEKEEIRQSFAKSIKRLQDEREQLKMNMGEIESKKASTLSEIRAIDEAIKALKQDIEIKNEEAKEIILSNERTITSIKEKEDVISSNTKRIADYEEKTKALIEQLEVVKREIIETQALYDAKNETYFSLKKQRGEKEGQQTTLAEEIQHSEEEITRFSLEQQNKERLLTRIEEECTLQRNEIDRKRREKMQFEKDLEQVIAEQEEHDRELKELTEKLNLAEHEYENAERDLHDRQEACAGCKLAVEAVSRRLKERSPLQLIKQRFEKKYQGLYRELIDVEEGYESVVDICCGDILNYYVVDDYTGDSFDGLPDGKFGFISVASNITQDYNEVPPSHLDSVVRFVKFKSSAHVLERYLGNYYLVDDPAEAKSLSDRFPGRGFVTHGGVLFKDGTAVMERGDFGYFKAKQSLEENKQKLETLNNEVLFLGEEKKRLHEAIDDIKHRIDSQKEVMFTLNVKKSEHSLRINETSQGIHKLSEDSNTLTNDRSVLEKEIDMFMEKKARLQDIISQHKQEVEQLETFNRSTAKKCEVLEGELEEIRVRLNDKKIDKAALEERLNSMNAACTQLAEETREIEREVGNLKETRSAQQYEEVQMRIDSLKSSLKSKEETRAQVESLLPEKAAEELTQKLNGIFDQLDTEQKAHEEIQNDIMQLKYEAFQLKVRKDELLSKARDELSVNLHDYVIDEEVTDVESRLAEVRGKLERLGEVNPLSLELFENEKRRLDGFLKQRDDIITAKRTLLTSIEELDERARERFTKVFVDVKEQFDFVFSNFFEGGHADLVLSDPDNPLVSKIDIVVRMKGKRLKIINQLSGGERTLLAISLLLAFYLVKPAPFCILDEIDAPLDDANVVRFNKFLRELSQRTQVIIITHNRATMEYTDYLYGLTMEKPGQSKIISARLADLERIGAIE